MLNMTAEAEGALRHYMRLRFDLARADTDWLAQQGDLPTLRAAQHAAQDKRDDFRRSMAFRCMINSIGNENLEEAYAELGLRTVLRIARRE